MKAGPILAAALMAGWASVASAAAPQEWDCDAPEGVFSELTQVQAGPTYRVRGTISWVRSRNHARWLPSGQVRIENRDRTRSVGIQMVAARGEERIDYGLASSDGGERSRESLGTAARNEAIPFEIQVSATGHAVVMIGGERATAQVDLAPGAKVFVVCSTGEFLFAGLDFDG